MFIILTLIVFGQKRLAKHRQEWIKRKQDEKQEQQMIRDHEEKVVG